MNRKKRLKNGKFRLPRKIKKKLKKEMWLYPADNKGSSLMARPYRIQEDYIAAKKGVVRRLIDPKNAKARKKEYREKLDHEIIVTDEQLKIFVDEIFEEKYRKSSYNTLIMAKRNLKAIIAYYNFVNAYNLFKNGEESYSNVCCMAIDSANNLLKG